MSKEESNCIGVNIVNTGKLTDTRINRFKLAQIIKASFLVDFNTARVMINDLFEKLKDPNATYLIKGFNFSKEIFEKMADEHDIEYVYVHERSAIISDINTDTKESNDSYPAVLVALSDYIKGLEKEKNESQQLLIKQKKEITQLKKTIVSLASSLLEISENWLKQKDKMNEVYAHTSDILFLYREFLQKMKKDS